MISGKRVVCFHSPGEENDYLSNWYLCNFNFKNISYTSMEQYMMHQKAILFNDTEIAEQILNTSDFATIKALGRKVRNFNQNTWDDKKEAIVTSGLFCKFDQNSELKEKLLSTGDDILAECAVRDKIWGIGLSVYDNDRFNPNLWKGQNLLGKCLMEVRKMLSNHK